jgi:hypothetical protein
MMIMAPMPAGRQGKPDPKKEEVVKIGNVGQLLYESIIQSGELHENYDEPSAVFSKGEIDVLSDPEMDGGFIPVTLDHYPAIDWRKKLVIRREGREFFLEEKTDQRKRINYGILMHKALSLVHYKSDVEGALKRLNLEGVIIEEEAVLLRKKMDAMMDHPLIGNWFKKEWQVLTEIPVIIPGGTQDRLDRVIHKEHKNTGKHKAVIIDYKTGVRRAEDRKQVEAYSLALMQMGYVDVEGFLLYLDDMEVVPIVSKTNLSLF